MTDSEKTSTIGFPNISSILDKLERYTLQLKQYRAEIDDGGVQAMQYDRNVGGAASATYRTSGVENKIEKLISLEHITRELSETLDMIRESLRISYARSHR